jgi:hypothetical protein
MRSSAERAFPGLPDVCVVAASDAEFALRLECWIGTKKKLH